MTRTGEVYIDLFLPPNSKNDVVHFSLIANKFVDIKSTLSGTVD